MKKIRSNKMKKQISKKCSLRIVLVTLAIILLGLLSGLAFAPAHAAVIQFNEFQITSNSASQINPDISGTNIVYQDNRSFGTWDIYMNNVWGSAETRITNNMANQINPRISGNKIVYQDDRNLNWDIYMYDLTTQTETQITNNSSSQENPAIDGNRIVWQDNRNGNYDIYMYDLSTQTERRVTTSGSNIDPSISGDRIVYSRGVDVFWFDLSSGNENLVWSRRPNLETNAGHPAIHGSRVVWDMQYYYSAAYGYEWDVHMRDVVTGATWNTDWRNIGNQYQHSTNQQYPHISELYTGVHYIVYQVLYPTHLLPSTWCSNIHLYHTDWQTEYRVTSNYAANQMYPRVSGGYIVYQDDRNGNWDIYVTMVGYVVGDPPPPTPAAAIEKIEAIEDIIADPDQIPTSDIDGAKSKVKENRREALLNKLDAVIASIQAAADSTDPASRTADYQSAIDQLILILDKTDGCALRETPDTIGTGFTPDWIITCDSQAVIDPLFRSSIAILQQLLE